MRLFADLLHKTQFKHSLVEWQNVKINTQSSCCCYFCFTFSCQQICLFFIWFVQQICYVIGGKWDIITVKYFPSTVPAV